LSKQIRGPAPCSQALQERYFRDGGLAGGDEVASRLRPHVAQPISTLARWIVAREVVVMPCERVLLPLFQFDFKTGRVKPAVAAALAELRDVFDDWDLISWFATPNALLSASSPMEFPESQGAALLDAARTDRFIAAG
jgi:hypothetical protein